MLLRGEGNVGQPLDVLAGVVVEAPGVLALGVTVLVRVCRDLAAQPGRFCLLGALKYRYINASRNCSWRVDHKQRNDNPSSNQRGSSNMCQVVIKLLWWSIQGHYLQHLRGGGRESSVKQSSKDIIEQRLVPIILPLESLGLCI